MGQEMWGNNGRGGNEMEWDGTRQDKDKMALQGAKKTQKMASEST